MGATYAADVTPQQAYEALRDTADAVLVDVRTAAEWAYVGLPDLQDTGARLVCLEWQSFPSGEVDEDFVTHLRDEGVSDGPVYFLCRSGVRSRAAATAVTAAGFTRAFNILEGFEGPLDPAGHRVVSGWKNSGLPWRQG